MNPEQIGLWAGLILSLMVFSYVLGDNFLYRLAVYIFVGLAAAYVTIVTVENVLLPWLNTMVLGANGDTGRLVIGLVPFILGLMLLFKSSPRLGCLGNLALAFIIGVGAAVALVGAISGTLLPLTNTTAAMVNTDLLNGFILVLGVISSLIYFQYLARRAPGGGVRQSLPVRFFGSLGRGFIVVTLGALYGGAILTGLTIFSERIAFILSRIGGG